MRTIVSGGTGFLGRPLCDALVADGHQVTVLTRRARGAAPRPSISYVAWQPDGSAGPWRSALEGAGAVINLAGESIAARRWTAAQKERIRQSRLQATRSLVQAVSGASKPPDVFISGSAIGYYGNRGAEPLTEDSAPGADYLASVCVEWEGEAALAAGAGARVAFIRTGIVLERDGGALAKMLTPFKLFAGGPLGSGRQYMSWIHREDWVALVGWALRERAVGGPINATAPAPVTNAAFSDALGRALGRPSWLPAPAFALRLALGEMADALLLGGQRVMPSRAERLGFRFTYPTLEPALAAIFRR